jgi:hypothetical protein
LSPNAIFQVNTFQVIIATDGIKTFVLFLYEDIQWGSSHNVIGFNAGDQERSYTLPESWTTNAILNLESTSNVGIPGAYIFRVDQTTITAPTCMFEYQRFDDAAAVAM